MSFNVIQSNNNNGITNMTKNATISLYHRVCLPPPFARYTFVSRSGGLFCSFSVENQYAGKCTITLCDIINLHTKPLQIDFGLILFRKTTTEKQSSLEKPRQMQQSR